MENAELKWNKIIHGWKLFWECFVYFVAKSQIDWLSVDLNVHKNCLEFKKGKNGKGEGLMCASRMRDNKNGRKLQRENAEIINYYWSEWMGKNYEGSDKNGKVETGKGYFNMFISQIRSILLATAQQGSNQFWKPICHLKALYVL